MNTIWQIKQELSALREHCIDYIKEQLNKAENKSIAFNEPCRLYDTTYESYVMCDTISLNGNNDIAVFGHEEHHYSNDVTETEMIDIVRADFNLEELMTIAYNVEIKEVQSLVSKLNDINPKHNDIYCVYELDTQVYQSEGLVLAHLGIDTYHIKKDALKEEYEQLKSA